MAKIEFRRVELYVDQNGRQIKAFETVPRDKKRVFYRGVGNMLAQSPGAPPQRVSFEFGFPDGIELEKAFETFDVEAAMAVDKFRQEQAKKIVPAKAVPNLLGPNGQRI